jgi:hypothetical protein
VDHEGDEGGGAEKVVVATSVAIDGD